MKRMEPWKLKSYFIYNYYFEIEKEIDTNTDVDVLWCLLTAFGCYGLIVFLSKQQHIEFETRLESDGIFLFPFGSQSKIQVTWKIVNRMKPFHLTFFRCFVCLCLVFSVQCSVVPVPNSEF